MDSIFSLRVHVMWGRHKLLYVMACLVFSFYSCAHGPSIHTSVKKGDMLQVQNYLDKSGDPNTKTKDGITPLMVAAQGDNINIVKLLIDKGADVNAIDKIENTPLMYAALGDSTEIVKLLIDEGADVNAINIAGNTALMYSAQGSVLWEFVGMIGQFRKFHGNKAPMVKMLIDKGADVNAKGKVGATPLMFAAKGGYPRGIYFGTSDASDIRKAEQDCANIVKLLIDEGADVNAKTMDGDMAYMYALRRRRYGIARLLIDKLTNVPSGVAILVFPEFVYFEGTHPNKSGELPLYVLSLSPGFHTLNISYYLSIGAPEGIMFTKPKDSFFSSLEGKPVSINIDAESGSIYTIDYKIENEKWYAWIEKYK